MPRTKAAPRLRDRILDLRRIPARDLQDHQHNWRVHPQAQREAMQGVLQDLGIASALLVYDSPRQGGLCVIDGHLRKSLDPAQEWPCLMLDLDDDEATYLLATHDPLGAMAEASREALAQVLDQVTTGQASVQQLLADLAEQSGVVPPLDDASLPETNYSRKIETPLYLPTGPQPALTELYTTVRTEALLADIEASTLPEPEKAFLRLAAQRHTVFNYHYIAEYYAHADAATQRLMEDSALVIIDFDRAIELGYVKLSEAIAQQYREEYGDAR